VTQLDTLRPERFTALTRANHEQVEGIAALGPAGFTGRNKHRMRNISDDEAVAIEYGRTVPAGAFHRVHGRRRRDRWTMDGVVSRSRWCRPWNSDTGGSRPVEESTRRPIDTVSRSAVFGIISSTTQPFCASCDRSRLTADGVFYLCLYAQQGVDLRGPLRRGASRDELSALITGAWSRRADRGAEERLRLRDRTPLVQIGRLRADPHLEMHTRGG
jgi:cyclic pyranopterin phosphate synthase